MSSNNRSKMLPSPARPTVDNSGAAQVNTIVRKPTSSSSSSTAGAGAGAGAGGASKSHAENSKDVLSAAKDRLMGMFSSSASSAKSASENIIPVGGSGNSLRDLHAIHNTIRARERDAEAEWKKNGQPDASEKLKKATANHETMKKQRIALTKKVQDIADARLNHYKSFLTGFYAKYNPEKTKQEVSDVLSYYCAPTAPERILHLFAKLQQVYGNSRPAMDDIEAEMTKFPPNKDKLEDLVNELITLERSVVRSSTLKDELRRELYFPTAPVGIAPKWLIRNSFEGFYNAFGDLWIEEMDSLLSIKATVNPPSNGKTEPQVVVSFVMNPDQSEKRYKVLARIENFSMLRKELPIPYNCRELLIEFYPSLTLEADFVSERSQKRPLGYWMLNEKTYKAKLSHLKAKYKGVTAGISPPNPVMELTFNTMLSYMIRRVFLQLLPPELGLYCLNEYKRENSSSSSSPKPYIALNLQSVLHVHGRYRESTVLFPLSEVAVPYPDSRKLKVMKPDASEEKIEGDDVVDNEAGEDAKKMEQKILDAFGLSKTGLLIFLDAQRYLHLDGKFGSELRLAKSANSDKGLPQTAMVASDSGIVPLSREKFEPAIDSLNIFLRYYHRFIAPLDRDERATVVNAWQRALDASSADLFPTLGEKISFLSILECLEKVDRKPLRMETKLRMDMKGDIRGLVSVMRGLFLRVFSTSASHWGGIEFRRPNAASAAASSSLVPVEEEELAPVGLIRKSSDIDMSSFTKERRIRSFSTLLKRVYSQKEAQSFIEEQAENADLLLDFVSERLLRTMDLQMDALFAGGEFRSVLEKVVVQVPLNAHIGLTGELLAACMKGTSPEWPWKHTPSAHEKYFEWLITPVKEEELLQSASSSSSPRSSASEPPAEIRCMLSGVTGSLSIIPAKLTTASSPSLGNMIERTSSSSAAPPVGGAKSASTPPSLSTSSASAPSSTNNNNNNNNNTLASDALKFSFMPTKEVLTKIQKPWYVVDLKAPDAYMQTQVGRLEVRGSLRTVKKYGDGWLSYLGDNAPSILHLLMSRMENYDVSRFSGTQAMKVSLDCSTAPAFVFSTTTLDEIRPAMSFSIELRLMDIVQDFFDVLDLLGQSSTSNEDSLLKDDGAD